MHRHDHESIAKIIRSTESQIGRWPGYDMPSLPGWHEGPVCLIGDAAHATLPSAGQGASMALEDAIVLAKCLRDLPDAERAFAAFETLRKDRVEKAGQGGAQKRQPEGPHQRSHTRHPRPGAAALPQDGRQERPKGLLVQGRLGREGEVAVSHSSGGRRDVRDYSVGERWRPSSFQRRTRCRITRIFRRSPSPRRSRRNVRVSISGSTETLSFCASRRMNMGTYAMARKLKMENQYKGECIHAARTKATGTGGSTYL